MADSILIVEDDPVIRTFLADNLTADGYDLLVAGTIEDALHELEARRPDLAVVDLRLPDGSGLDLIRRVRSADGIGSRLDPSLPLVVLSGCGGELDRVRGFERGVDDYVVKAVRVPRAAPADRRGVAALARAGASRAAARRRARDRSGGARWRRSAGGRSRSRRRSSRCCGRWRRRPTRVFTKEELLREVWGFRAFGSTRTLDSHACRLRQKLRGQGDQFIVNVWGVGYRLVDGPSESEPAL